VSFRLQREAVVNLAALTAVVIVILIGSLLVPMPAIPHRYFIYIISTTIATVAGLLPVLCDMLYDLRHFEIQVDGTTFRYRNRPVDWDIVTPLRYVAYFRDDHCIQADFTLIRLKPWVDNPVLMRTLLPSGTSVVDPQQPLAPELATRVLRLVRDDRRETALDLIVTETGCSRDEAMLAAVHAYRRTLTAARRRRPEPVVAMSVFTFIGFWVVSYAYQHTMHL